VGLSRRHPAPPPSRWSAISYRDFTTRTAGGQFTSSAPVRVPVGPVRDPAGRRGGHRDEEGQDRRRGAVVPQAWRVRSGRRRRPSAGAARSRPPVQPTSPDRTIPQSTLGVTWTPPASHSGRCRRGVPGCRLRPSPAAGHGERLNRNRRAEGNRCRSPTPRPSGNLGGSSRPHNSAAPLHSGHDGLDRPIPATVARPS